ncbi:hypothetical protein LWI29_003376 [Acer saccharum]|uniref:Uncharacterized protein n=1 Tax=Acer saccharum TaxID=4024 RepID=A0AA39SNC3_ACESA|nr:hypothetical protein LWI29_003376 [Acer saccharum]
METIHRFSFRLLPISLAPKHLKPAPKFYPTRISYTAPILPDPENTLVLRSYQGRLASGIRRVLQKIVSAPQSNTWSKGSSAYIVCETLPMRLEISMEMLVPSQNAVLLVIDYYTNIWSNRS